MPGTDDLSRSLVAFEEDSTLVAVIDMSLSSWGRSRSGCLVPGLRRRPEKKPRADEEGLLVYSCICPETQEVGTTKPIKRIEYLLFQKITRNLRALTLTQPSLYFAVGYVYLSLNLHPSS